MNRRKIIEVVLTVAVLGAVGAWSYSSGSSSATSSAGLFATSSNPDPGVSATPTTKSTGSPGRATTSVATTTVPAPVTTVAANPAAYATALFGYWTHRDHANATKVASAPVVQRLFNAAPWVPSDGWVSKGCQSAAGGISCTWAARGRHFIFEVQSTPLQVVALRITHP